MAKLQQVRKGSTPLLILSVLAAEKMYGYQIMRELEQRSDGYFTMTAALLYPALHQLEKDGLVESEWQELPRQAAPQVLHHHLQGTQGSCCQPVRVADLSDQLV